MPDVTTITNVPPTPDMPDPSLLTEVTALIVAITALLAVIVWPVLIGYGLKKFHGPISDLLKRVRAAEGMGVKVNMDDLEKKAIAAEFEGDSLQSEASVSSPNVDEDDAASDETDGSATEAVSTAAEQEVDQEAVAESAVRRRRRRNIGEVSGRVHAWKAMTDDLQNLAKIHPPSAVLWAWTEVESSLSKLADACAVSSPIVLVSIGQLHTLGVIPPILKSLLFDLWQVRQQMAAGSEITYGDAIKFGRSADQARRELDDLRFAHLMGIVDRPKPTK